ncbi:MAG: hypothetical protein KF752_03010 [Pirellulaceae bacterium]|nr:hypothetical protein [Pirellulaceae bacterium]
MQTKTPVSIWRLTSVWATQISAWFWMVCLWLPLSVGSNDSIRRPIGIFHVSSELFAEQGLTAASLISFSNIWFVAGGILLVAVTHSRALWIAGFALQALVSLLLVVLMTVWTASEFQHPRDAIPPILAWGLPLILSAAWIGEAAWHRRWVDTWARFQHCWTIMAWLFLQLMTFLFIRQLMYGYVVASLCLMTMVVSVELARCRMVHELWDRAAPVEPFHFSIRSLLIWMTVLAGIIAYYQGVNVFLTWLDEQPTV